MVVGEDTAAGNTASPARGDFCCANSRADTQRAALHQRRTAYSCRSTRFLWLAHVLSRAGQYAHPQWATILQTGSIDRLNLALRDYHFGRRAHYLETPGVLVHIEYSHTLCLKKPGYLEASPNLPENVTFCALLRGQAAVAALPSGPWSATFRRNEHMTWKSSIQRSAPCLAPPIVLRRLPLPPPQGQVAAPPAELRTDVPPWASCSGRSG